MLSTRKGAYDRKIGASSKERLSSKRFVWSNFKELPGVLDQSGPTETPPKLGRWRESRNKRGGSASAALCSCSVCIRRKQMVLYLRLGFWIPESVQTATNKKDQFPSIVFKQFYRKPDSKCCIECVGIFPPRFAGCILGVYYFWFVI